MNIRIKLFVFSFTVLLFFVCQSNVIQAGFGVSPASVTNKNLIPGSFYEQDISLVQSNPDVALNVFVTIDAGEINNWIKIENGNSFIIPKGVQQFPMKVFVTVPPDAEFGNYKGLITVNTVPVGSQKSGVSVTLGGNIVVDLEVTSLKFSEFSIQNFKIPDVVKGSPIKFVIKVKNDGNVENGPTKVGLTYFDKYHSEQLGQQEEVIAERVGPFQVKDLSVGFTNNLDVGQYWADVKIYSQDKVVINSKIVFNVVSVPVSKKISIPFWVYLLALAVVIIIVLILIVIKNKKS